MKLVIQRVKSASVNVENKTVSSIDNGILILLGISNKDSGENIIRIASKIAKLRIFNDENANMNLSIDDVGGEALVISQFTLCADTNKGQRPSFIAAAPPEMAYNMYQQYCKKLRKENISVQTGQFGAMMEVKLVNDGPVTIVLNSKER